MILFKKKEALIAYLGQKKSAGKKVGFVPTMGALHAGHLSLIEASKQNSDITVCSIFVNPTQFNDPKDFQKYPITIESDIFLLEKNETDVLFLPSVEDIYPNGTNQLGKYDLGYLETILEGKYRPGHFQGVCQVMDRLLGIVQPDHLFMGQKDFQQCMVVKRLLKILNSSLVFHSCPILREEDGLAMSSRNMRLTKEERKNAPAIYQSLIYLKENIGKGKIEDHIHHAKKMLEEADFKIDYVEIADANTLNIIHSSDNQHTKLALIAAFQHETRLIDNMILNRATDEI